jgi:uncharacterized protein YndB with AHSA1/START domain
MAAFTNVVEIDRPAHDVFAFLVDLENVPRWNYAITATRKTSPVRWGWERRTRRRGRSRRRTVNT